jgi:hypothetical protein
MDSNTPAYNALAIQVGGSHYKGMKIQHVEFVHANQIPYIEACSIKYICRHRLKNGRQDVEKAIHYLQLLLTLDYAFNRPLRLDTSSDMMTPAYFMEVNDITNLYEQHAITMIFHHRWNNGRKDVEDAIRSLQSLLAEEYPSGNQPVAS